MKQLEFEKRHSAFWAQLEAYLSTKISIEKSKDSAQDFDLPDAYRRMCQHLAIAKSRGYSRSLVLSLNGQVQNAYLRMYGRSAVNKGGILEFIVYGFPAALRSNAGYLWAAAAVFVLPYLSMLIACYLNDELIYSVMDAGQVRGMESMYDPSLSKFGRERQSDTDFYMFGFYIFNNIGIAFRCFASGLFLGIGSLFTLAYNGLVIGAVEGHLTNIGFSETFHPFVIGHGSFELTAIVFSGAAGLKLGFVLLAPGAHSRLSALKIAAADAIKIMYGVFLMLFVAAFIEAFWSSSSTMPNAVKYAVGSILWIFVFYYCFFFARHKVAAYHAHHSRA